MSFRDSIVIYFSDEDRCWIAHSLKTDQIGTGDRVVDAVADVLTAIGQVVDGAKSDPTLAVYRDAPSEILEMFRQADPLPKEVFEAVNFQPYQ